MSSSRYRIPDEHIYEGMVLSGAMEARSIDLLKMTVLHDSDVVVDTYPKAGTTVMQEIAYLIQSDGDFKMADEISLDVRSPHMEVTKPADGAWLADLLKVAPPRIFKSHLPARIFKETLRKSNAKFLIVMREPKDVLVSTYFFYQAHKLCGYFTGTWDDFFRLFVGDWLCYGNYFDHVLSWWDERHNPNVAIIMYEDIVRKPIEVIRQVAAHLDKTVSDELVHKIADRIKFENMKKIPTANKSDNPFYRHDISPFLRKGQVGDWQNYFSEEQRKIVDDMYEKRCVENGMILQF